MARLIAHAIPVWPPAIAAAVVTAIAIAAIVIAIVVAAVAVAWEEPEPTTAEPWMKAATRATTATKASAPKPPPADAIDLNPPKTT